MVSENSTNIRKTTLQLVRMALVSTISLAALLAGAATAASVINDAPATSAQTTAYQPATFLAWDADAKECNPKPGELAAHFTFYVTNMATEAVIITDLQRSCGCTEAKLPEQPWRLEPGSNGLITATIDLRGKSGRISKMLTVRGTAGTKTLVLNVNVPPASSPTGAFNPERSQNLQIASQDRQAVFKGECAKCHVEPAKDKLGKELYQAGCAICHEAENRAAMVPDLRALNHPTNAEHWRRWVADSKPGSLMPAFAEAAGGPLTDHQINSLVAYLQKTVSSP